MLNSKFFITLVGIVVVIYAICGANGQSFSEGFLLGAPKRGVQVAQSLTNAKTGHTFTSHNSAAIKQGIASSAMGVSGPKKGDMMQVPGTYSAMLEPRFSNVNFGAQIKYNLPSAKNLASPATPLTFANMAKENYSGPAQGCRAGGLPSDSKPIGTAVMDANYAAGNFNNLRSSLEGTPVLDTLPAATMTSLNAEGNQEQFYVANRLIFGMSKTRNTNFGDPIRGDLAFSGNDCSSGSQWFQVSKQPSRDLRVGALTVMGGANANDIKMAETLKVSNGGLLQAHFGGAYNDLENATINMSSQKNTTIGATARDIKVRAFA